MVSHVSHSCFNLTDLGSNGIIYHHESSDIWAGGTNCNTYWCRNGLKAVMIDAYVDYTLNGEGYLLAEIDEPNDPYFRYVTSGYGMSQAYGAHKRHQAMKTAMSEGEKQRLLGENLNGMGYTSKVLYSPWLSHFKPAYDERREEYLFGNFDPDVDWPIDGHPVTGGWFREPLDVNVTDIASSSATIHWTTPQVADSNVVYTKVSNGIWWWWKDSEGQWWGPDGGEHDANMVTDHTIILSYLDANTPYEFRIRSTNDPNDEPNIPGQIIWGYVDDFNAQ